MPNYGPKSAPFPGDPDPRSSWFPESTLYSRNGISIGSFFTAILSQLMLVTNRHTDRPRYAAGAVQQAPALSSNGATAWRSATNAGRVTLTADGEG